VRRLELTESARADLKSIRRYSLRTWGAERTGRYMVALRETMKDLVSAESSANVTTFDRSSEWSRAAVRLNTDIYTQIGDPYTQGRHRQFEAPSIRLLEA
jgi:hypothetical protein